MGSVPGRAEFYLIITVLHSAQGNSGNRNSVYDWSSTGNLNAMIEQTDEETIRSIAKNEIYNDKYRSQYEVGPIAYHTHNGVDSSQVDPNDLTNSSLYYAVR